MLRMDSPSFPHPSLFYGLLGGLLLLFAPHTAQTKTVQKCPDSRQTFQRWPSPRYRQTLVSGLETQIWNLSKQLKQQSLLKKRTLFIAVHTTTRGSNAYNFVRSHKRALAIREKLIEHGLPSDRIAAQGYGENCTLFKGFRLQRKNARVDIYLTLHNPPNWRAEAMTNKPSQHPTFKVLEKHTIFYSKDQTLPPVRAQRTILALMKRLQHDKMLRLRVETHCTPNENVTSLNASKKRARALYRIFSRHHISSHQLGFTSYGPSRPIASNRTKKGRARNRRTVLTLLRRTSP